MQPRRRPGAVRLAAMLLSLLAPLGMVIGSAPVCSPAWAQAPQTPPEPAPQIVPPVQPGAEPQPAAEQPAVPVLEAEKAPAARPLQPPADRLPAQAWQILDKHCARCHQVGKLKRPDAAAGFGNILRLDDIASDPVLVVPGNPDASRLYTHVLRRLMPFDVHKEATGGEEPSPDEMTALRAWIAGLPLRDESCRGRQPVTKDQIAAAMMKSAESASAGADAGPNTIRFISLAHLYNACASDEAMFVWRQAVVRLFNSLSWRAEPIRVEPVDEARTLLKVDLASLGWVPAHWERITQAAPNPAGHLISLPPPVYAAFKTQTPVVRGDWLANVVTRAPLYYDLLGLPEIGPEIAKILQLDLDPQRRAGSVLRAGVRPSQVSRSGRLIERATSPKTTLWQAFDVAARDGQRDPSEAAATIAVPPHDVSLSMFTLPNGFPAFYALNPRGGRLDRTPADIAKPSLAPRGSMRVGLDCMGCHASGPQHRAEEQANSTGIAAAAVSDRATNKSAARAALLDPDHVSEWGEPVTALARQYTRPLSFARLQAELGAAGKALADLAREGSSPANLVRRATQGIVPRAEVEAEWPALLAALHLAPAPAGSTPAFIPVDETLPQGPAVQLLSDKSRYKTGDPLILTAKAATDCYLTLVSVDARGRGTVIFPSDFEQNNLLPAGRTLRLPGDGAPYVFRLREKGREAVVAVCSPAGGAVDGIRHDFERQRFTDLGDYATFLAQAMAAEQEARRGKAQPAPPPEPKRRNRARSRDRNDPSEQRPKPDQVSRTAITIVVE